MKIAELTPIFDQILDNTVRAVKSGNRNLIINERYYHHQFSHYTARHFERRRIDPWKSQLIIPEHPTAMKFAWGEFGLKRPKTTLKMAIGRGNVDKYDFVIADDPKIFVEWKGPRLYLARDVAIDITKLVAIGKHRPVKVFAAILVNTGKNEFGHHHEMQARFYEGMNFVQKIFDIPDMHKINLYAYIAAVSQHGASKFIWGRV